ncbi:MAG: cob(I)yrinic acid a,c-diamide adenosyltransferase [Bacilli bacterium]|jgi:cob(I)alamin adenosyltransferase|nr:cob(I)yrinic acid a,c-diamide adenosyltransferase [Bacilli bacterium]MDY0064312.1 cob(I)yrinic acid a,c-diamide adenosyltransferase [Bacilli bacterium]
MKITTKTGDRLMTSTIKKRVYKNDPLINIEGHLDELQSQLMVAYSSNYNSNIKTILKSIVENLFLVGYDITSETEQVPQEWITNLEQQIDTYEQILSPLKEFILPGKTLPAAQIHLARSVARRTERVIVEYAIHHLVHPPVLIYMNRLSDLLFLLGRFVDEKDTSI